MSLPPLPAAVVIRDVGPRDGLQPEAPVAIADRVRLVEALVDAGVQRIEAAAFVSPKAVPAMAGAAEVMAAVPWAEGVNYSVLVPNVRGAELALQCDVDELTVTASLSETYSQRNVRMSVDESAEAIAGICAIAGDVPVDAVLSCSFGSPYEGDIAPAAVSALADRLRASGCAAITCADTTGMATPRRIAEVAEAVGTDIGLHLHETRGRPSPAPTPPSSSASPASTRPSAGSAVRRSPPVPPGTWRPRSVALLDDLQVVTGIDVEALIDAAHLAGDLVGRAVPSRVAAAGPRSRRAGEP